MRKIILFLALIIVLAFNVVAVPPFPDTATGSGISILHPVLESIKLGETAYLHFHALNSTGFILNTSQYTCGLHFYGDDGNDIYATNSIPIDTLTPNNPYDRLLILNSTIINESGLYSYNMWCNSTKESGALVNYFWVTKDGKTPENPVNAYFFIGGILGIIGLIIIMILIYSKLDDKEHWLIKTIIILLAIYLTLFIPRFIHFNLQDVISYDFLKYYMWFIRIFTIYLFGYFLYSMINYYGKLDWIKKIIKDNFGKKK